MDRVFPHDKNVRHLIISRYLSSVDLVMLFSALGSERNIGRHSMWLPNAVAELGYINILQWLAGMVSASASLYAARGGQLNTLRWLRDKGLLSEDALLYAASAGHLDVIKWLILDAGCKIGELVCAAAARWGHLEVLMWLREHGAAWNSQTFTEASRHGDTKVLAWLKDQQCPMDRRKCANCAHPNAMKWLRENVYII